MNGHWHCGEPMEICGTDAEGNDIYECTLCGTKSSD